MIYSNYISKSVSGFKLLTLPKRFMWACSLKGAKRSQLCTTTLFQKHVSHYMPLQQKRCYQSGVMRSVTTQGDSTGKHPVYYQKICKKIGCEDYVCPSSPMTCEQEDRCEAVGNLTHAPWVNGKPTVSLTTLPDLDASGNLEDQNFYKYPTREPLNRNQGWEDAGQTAYVNQVKVASIIHKETK